MVLFIILIIDEHTERYNINIKNVISNTNNSMSTYTYSRIAKKLVTFKFVSFYIFILHNT